MSDPQVGGVARDGTGLADPKLLAKMKAANALGAGKAGGSRQTQDDEDEDDEAAWQKEKEALQRKRKERLEREAKEKGGESGAPAGSQQKPPAGGDAAAGDKPKPKKKLLNGTNIEYRYPSGSAYTGGFKDGKLHGYGKYKYHPSGDVYEGEWLADMKHGQGSYTYEGGDKYTGEWRAGKKHGKGTYIFQTGDEYIGSWKEDKIHGHGVFSIARNGNRYEGNWEESYRHGAGTLKSGNGDLYEGNWIRGKEEGSGVLTYSNGNIYAGGWRGGQMDGKGIMKEKQQKYTVEHIAGYLISKVPVEETAVVDPDWNNANRLYEAHLKKVANGGSAGDAGGGGKNVESSDAFVKCKLERDMYEKKYQDLLAAKTSAGEGFDDDDDGSDIATLRKKLAAVREERDGQKIRADDAVSKEKVLLAEIEELKFKLKDAGTGAPTGGGGGGGGGGAVMDSDEYKELQRKCAEMERQLGKTKGDGAAGNEKLDPLEMKAKLELQESELKSLKANREELKKARENNLDNQKTIMGLEQRNEELLKEITVQRQRAGHLQNQLQDGPDEDHMTELRQLRKDAEASAKEKETLESQVKKAKKQAKDLEERARKADELEVELVRIRQSKQTSDKVSFGALDKKSDEVDNLRNQNAELQRKLEEMGVEGDSPAPNKKDKKKKKKKGDADEEDADGMSMDDLKVKIEGIQSDLKKEKKKHKRAAGERDVYEQQLLVDQAALRKVQRQLHVAHGKVMVYALVRPLLPFESERNDQSIIGPHDQAGMVINRQSEQTFAFDEVFAETASGADLFVEAQPTVRKVVEGSHAALLSYGPMDAGKTFYSSQIAPLAIQELFASFKSSSQQVTVNCTALELTEGGIVDLLSGNSDASNNIELRKNGYGVVSILKATTNVCGSADEALRQYTQALAAKTKSRSHFCFFLAVELKNKVTEATGKGKLSLIDLCGPGELGEMKDVAAGKYVNNSMRGVGSVIQALTDKSSSVPYCDDVLTTILSDVFGGNSRTHMFTHCSPSSYTANETMHSVGLAQKASAIYNRPLRQFDTADTIYLRNLVKTSLSEEQGQQKFYDITSFQE